MPESFVDLLPFLAVLVPWCESKLVALWKTQARARLWRWASRQVKMAWSRAGSLVRYRILRRETPEARKWRETAAFVAYRERRREALRVICPHVRVEFSEYSKEKIERRESLAQVTTLFVPCGLISLDVLLNVRLAGGINDLREDLHNVYFCQACDFGPVSRATDAALAKSWERILEDEPSRYREYFNDTARLIDEVGDLNRKEPVVRRYRDNGVRSTLTGDEVQRILKGID